jgi:hypothetical protein
MTDATGQYGRLYKTLFHPRELVEILIDSKINQLNTNLLVQVVTANSGQNEITVKVLSNRSYVDRNLDTQYVQLENLDVRLAYQKGFKSTIKSGDFGLLIVAQSDIISFLDSGVDKSNRKYALEDAIFIPMEISTVNTTDLQISAGAGENITVTSQENINMTSQENIDLTASNVTLNVSSFKVAKGTDDLIDAIRDLSAAVGSMAVVQATGIITPAKASQIAAITARLGAFVE